MASPPVGPATFAVFLASQLGLIGLSSWINSPSASTSTTTSAALVCPACQVCPTSHCECPACPVTGPAACPAAPECPSSGFSTWALVGAGLIGALCGVSFVSFTLLGVGVVAGFCPGLLTGWLARRLGTSSVTAHDGVDAKSEGSPHGESEGPLPLCW